LLYSTIHTRITGGFLSLYRARIKKTPKKFDVYGQVVVEQSIIEPAKPLALTHVLSLAFLTYAVCVV